MKKTHTLFIFLSLILLSFVSGQDYTWANTLTKQYDATEGAMYRHLYAYPVFYYPTVATPTTTSTISLTVTLPSVIFDSTQTISYATSLLDMSANAVDTTANQLTLWVENVTINAARTQYVLYIQFTRPGVTTFSRYNHVGFHTILIGSNFNRQSSPLASALARNSKLVDVSVTTSPVNTAQFDFTGTLNQPSPFAFIPDSAACGVSVVGGAQRVQVLGCQKPIIMTFVTGFTIAASALTVVPSVSSFAVLDKTVVATPTDSGIVTNLQINPISTEYIYQTSASDTVVGPTVIFKPVATSTLIKVQLSMVFCGLRVWSSATYPTSTPDSFIVSVGGLGYGTALTTASATIKDGLATGNPNLNLWTYGPNTNLGHMFCGVQAIGKATTSTLASTVDLRSTFPAPSATAQNLNIQTSGVTSDYAGACMLFATASTCVNQQNLVISTSATTSTSSTSIVVAAQTFTQSTASTWSPPKSLYNFAVSGINTGTPYPSRTTIIKSYPITAGQTEFVFYYNIDPTTLTAGQFSYQITIAGVTYPIGTVTADPTFGQIVFHVPASTTSILTNFTLIAASSGSDTVILQQGLYNYANVINNAQACATTCSEVVNQTTGVSSASNPPTCIYCSTAVNQVYSNGACVCINNYYLDTSSVCQPCSDSLCVSCTATTCSVCTGNATLSTSTLPASCICNTGFYKNGTQCLPCPLGCATCTSPTACTSCQNSANATGFITRMNITYNCRCIDGFFEVNTTTVCSPCNPLCQTCSVSANNCTSCNGTANFTLQQNSCVCNAGSYLLNNACIACSPICLTCDVSSIYCTSCPAMRVLAGTSNPAFKTCNCNTTAGYVQVDYVCVDATCSDIDPFCQTCTLDLTGLRLRQCLNCYDNRIIVQNQCVCKPGYYQGADGKCTPCGSGCQQCTNTTVCLSCATGSQNNGNGTCTCRSGSVLISFSASLYCQPCNLNCANCSVTSTNCQSCKPGFVLLTNNTCGCSVGFYLSTDGTQCLPCTTRCQLCSNQTNCDRCATGYIYDSVVKQCTLNCVSGFFISGSQCLACPVGCVSCYTQLICSSCMTNYSMYAGSCRAQCPDGTYSSSGQCYACNSSCKTCSSQNQCNSCNYPFVLLANRCVSDCQNGTFYGDGSCRACDPSCLTCAGYSTSCTSCPSPLILYNNTCYTICPVATVNGTCTIVCPSGSYLSGTSCLPCDTKCSTCFGSATNCTSCASGLSSNGNCIDNCPSGTFASNGFCSPCDVSCLTCQGSPFNCLQCANGYLRNGMSCVQNCPSGSFYNPAVTSCSPCGAGCQVCSSLSQCSVCADPTLTSVNGICQRACPAGATLIGNNCVCTFGVLQQSTCVSSCLDGFYATTDRVCALCSSPCFTCTGNSTSCSSCISGYSYDPISRTCTQTSQCPYGAYRDVNGQCQRYCPTSYFYAGGCIYQCPPGFSPNQYLGCVQSVTPTFCQIPLFLQGNACVNTCQLGFYGNSATRTCDRCFANCQQCLSATTCVNCVPGYLLNNLQTACIISSSCQPGQVQYNSVCYTSCPLGTYQQGQLCIRSCPPSTFFYNQYCYPFCPTQFGNADACVNQCAPNVPNCAVIF